METTAYFIFHKNSNCVIVKHNQIRHIAYIHTHILITDRMMMTYLKVYNSNHGMSSPPNKHQAKTTTTTCPKAFKMK